jgi:hypothetical protein
MLLDDPRGRRGYRRQGSSSGWWLLFLVLVLAGGGIWYFGPDALPGWVTGWLPGGPETTTLYKWQGEDGNWHIADSPPEGVVYEAVEVRKDVNVLPARNGD